MDTNDALRRAEVLLSEFGLYDWSAKLDRSTSRFGQCRFGPKEIGLSAALVRLNPIEEVEDTIRHEIAHALVGPGNGHGSVWKLKCVEVGARPKRCYDRTVVTPPKKWDLVCPAHGVIGKRDRRKTARMIHNGCGQTIAYIPAGTTPPKLRVEVAAQEAPRPKNAGPKSLEELFRF